jgi:hypothetical protein
MCIYVTLKRAAQRFVWLSLLVCLVVVTANAYTLIMRNGRRVEIPARFVVTASIVVYEVSPGMQVSLQLRSIDIPATERANNEEPGAFLRRAQTPFTPVASSPDVAPAKATRTITTRDLQMAANRRLESEVAYEKRIKELGLPSVEESRRRTALESASILQELSEKRMANLESEDYWRNRANEIRTDMAVLDAEIGFIQARIEEYPSPEWNAALTTVNPIPPSIWYEPRGRDRRYGRNGYPNVDRRGVFIDPNAPVRSRGRNGYGNRARRGNIFGNVGVYGPPIGVWPNIGQYPNTGQGSYYPSYDYSYERSALVTRFNELSGQRAGLSARWRQLEEAARRAGIPPGWLRAH